MIEEIADILNRSRATVVEDALGVAALFTLLFIGLGLTGTL